MSRIPTSNELREAELASFLLLTVCAPPQATAPTLWPSRDVTSSGVLLEAQSPRPSLPPSPRPKVKRRPSRVTTAEWWWPVDTKEAADTAVLPPTEDVGEPPGGLLRLCGVKNNSVDMRVMQ